MKKLKKAVSFAAAALMLSSLMTGCLDGGYEDETPETVRTAETTIAAATLQTIAEKIPAAEETVRYRKGMTMSLDGGGMLNVKRNIAGNTPMGEDGTWTIFVYMCGTDLETELGCGTIDLQEMLEASTDRNIKFVVETGGTAEWQNDVVHSGVNERFVIYGGDAYAEGSTERSSMGDESTLAEFLKWGVGNYPAAKMGLVCWNHGGGSITGVCFDETDDYDSLSLAELNSALSDVSEIMTDKFEFIGFDACLMGSVECANILASYSRYMYGSEETESGLGWDYTAIGSYLDRNPSADGAALGRVVCDSFYKNCELAGIESGATISCIDLSKIDDVIVSFNEYSKALYEATEDTSVLSNLIREMNGAESFGANNKSEGYTNMVDLAGIINAGACCVNGAESVIGTLNNAVIYKKNGGNHKNACGLSVYYPLNIQGSQELKIYGGIAVNPYYLAFVDRSVYHVSGRYGSYSSDVIMDLWDAMWDGEQDEAAYEAYCSYCDSYGEIKATGESPYIVFYDEPQMLEDGTFGFSLTDESLGYAASVQANVFMPSEDMEDLVELGISVDIYADWENGIFTDNFDGYWFSLPDGQTLAVYVVSECDGYDIYTSPVRINGYDTNLRITHDYVNGKITIDGAWDGVDENGMASRNIIPLERGDTVLPLYYAASVYSGEEYLYRGKEYVFDGDPEIYFDYLPDGEYYYIFYIYDIYGDYAVTDHVLFGIEDGKVYY